MSLLDEIANRKPSEWYETHGGGIVALLPEERDLLVAAVRAANDHIALGYRQAAINALEPLLEEK